VRELGVLTASAASRLASASLAIAALWLAVAWALS
jgi:hypothetical protein